MHRFITSPHRTPALALCAATSTCAIASTAAAYAPHNPHPEGAPDTSAPLTRRNVPCTYNMHMHRVYACACHLYLHLGRNAPPSATRIPRAACNLQRRNAPNHDAAYAQRTAIVAGSSYVQFPFQFLKDLFGLTPTTLLQWIYVPMCRAFGSTQADQGALEES